MEDQQPKEETEKQHQQQEEEQQIQEKHPFEQERELCDILIEVKEKTLYIHSSIFSSVSPFFKKNLLTQIEATKEEPASTIRKIVLEEDCFDPKHVIWVLSFYYPRYFVDLSDDSPFEDLLTICEKFKMDEFKYYIECYLQSNYSYEFNHSFTSGIQKPLVFTALNQSIKATPKNSRGYMFRTVDHNVGLNTFQFGESYGNMKRAKLSEKEGGSFCLIPCLQFLRLADKFQLENLRECLLELSFNARSFHEICSDVSFVLLQDATKYELVVKGIKSSLPNDHTRVDGTTTEVPNIEGTILLSFFEMLYYENRTIDQALPRKKIQKREKIFNIKVHHPFCADLENADRIIEVEDYKLHVNSLVLSENSPVFDRMLNGSFKEANEKIVRLEDDPVQLIQLLKHFYQHHEIKSADECEELLPLCRKYQVSWLMDKVKKYLTAHCQELVSSKLKYLRLADEYEMSELRRYLLMIPVESFISLQSNPEFNQLNKETKYLLALNRLKRLVFAKKQEYIPFALRKTAEVCADHFKDNAWLLVNHLDQLFRKMKIR